MNKYVILHNSFDKQSREFVQANPEYTAIDWYQNHSDPLYQEYMAKDLPHPTAFPAVVDTELRLICNQASSVQAAIDSFVEKIEEKWNRVKARRQELFDGTKWIQERHKDEVELDVTPSLTPEKYTAWLEYWQALRNITNQEHPDDVVWPELPSL